MMSNVLKTIPSFTNSSVKGLIHLKFVKIKQAQANVHKVALFQSKYGVCHLTRDHREILRVQTPRFL